MVAALSSRDSKSIVTHQGADFVLPTVAATDALGVIVLSGPVRAELVPDLTREIGDGLLAAQREYGDSDGRHARLQREYDASIALFVRDHAVGVAQQRKHDPVDADGGLDHVWDNVPVGRLVEVVEPLAR